MKTFVYFLAPVEGGAVKIGCSHVPIERLRAFQQWSPEPLQILATAPGTQADERFIHSIFKADRLYSEWFRPSARLLDMIDRVKATGQLDRRLIYPLPRPANASMLNSDPAAPHGLIRDYADRHGLKLKALAERLAVSVETLRLIDKGERKASLKLAVRIERETDGEIRAATLRPDLVAAVNAIMAA